MNSYSVEDFQQSTAPTRLCGKLLVLFSCWAFSSLGLVNAAIYPSNCVDSAGTIDPMFYRPLEPTSPSGASLNAVELSSGKILVALTGTYVGGLPDPVERSLLVRLHADGTPDPSFAFDDSNFERVWTAHAFAVSSNGLLAVATSGYGTEGFFYGHFHISHSDGSSVFSTYTSIDHSALVRALAWDGEGRVVIGGNFSPFHEGMPGGLARLNGDGSLDPTFFPATNFNFVIGLTVQKDGMLLVLNAGPTLESAALYRLKSDGSLDTNYVPAHFNDRFVEPDPHPPVPVVLQPDGKILIAGPFRSVNGTPRHSVVRLNTDGSLDSSFDPGGGAVGGRPEIHLALQPDGKVLLAGGFNSFNGIEMSGLVRLRRNGAVDDTFSSHGQFDNVGSVTVLKDGRLLVTSYLAYGYYGAMSPHRLFGDPEIRMLAPTLLSQNQLALEFTAVPGVPYVLQQSTTLTAWQSVSTNTASACTHRFTNGSSGAATFFRVQRQD
jgi:uncharacterized delta-60 repeat protein